MTTENSTNQSDNLYDENEINFLADKYAKEFTKFSDIEGIIIRGHILIEQSINRSIELTVLTKNEYNADRFSFAQKVQIGNMLGISGDFKTELNSLNKLRNQIAHSLKYDEKYIDIIINEIQKKSSEPFPDKKDKLKSLITAIGFMCGAISHAHNTARLKYILHQDKQIQNKVK
jgi:hypothetical protein